MAKNLGPGAKRKKNVKKAKEGHEKKKTSPWFIDADADAADAAVADSAALLAVVHGANSANAATENETTKKKLLENDKTRTTLKWQTVNKNYFE